MFLPGVGKLLYLPPLPSVRGGDFHDFQERFQRIRKAYALLSDEGSRELLLEAIEQEASCFAELSHGWI